MRSRRASSERPTLEICLVDATTASRITRGQLSVEPKSSGASELYREFGASGCVSLALDPGEYGLRLSSPGYIAVEQSVDLDSDQDHVSETLPLSREYVIRGLVRNASGQPQPDANVILVQKEFRKILRTGPAGTFEVRLISPEIDKVYAFRPANPIAEVGPISIAGAVESRLIIVTLPRDAPTVNVRARIVDDRGLPVQGAGLRLLMSTAFHAADKEDDAAIAAAQEVAGTSDANGTCNLPVPPDRDTVLQVSGSRGCEPTSEVINVAKDTVRDINLKCHRTFHVIVQDADGRAIEGARLVSETQSGAPAIYSAGRDGEYYALAYPFSIYAVTPPSSAGDEGLSRSVWIREYQAEVRLVLGDGVLEGRVTDTQGAPVRTFTVRLYQAGSDSYNVSFRFSSLDGSFTLKHVPPGNATIEVIGAIPDGGGNFVAGHFTQDIQVAEGQSACVRVVVIPESAVRASLLTSVPR